jgi:hypothetical protein
MNVKELKAQLEGLPDDYEVFAMMDMYAAHPICMPMFVNPKAKEVIFG